MTAKFLYTTQSSKYVECRHVKRVEMTWQVIVQQEHGTA